MHDTRCVIKWMRVCVISGFEQFRIFYQIYNKGWTKVKFIQKFIHKNVKQIKSEIFCKECLQFIHLLMAYISGFKIKCWLHLSLSATAIKDVDLQFGIVIFALLHKISSKTFSESRYSNVKPLIIKQHKLVT